MPEETIDVLERRALKAAREKARRSRSKPDYRPRDESMAVRLRREGVSSDAHYSRLRRERLKAEKACDGNACQQTEVVAPVSLPIIDGIACHSRPMGSRDGDPCQSHSLGEIDGNSCRITHDRLSDGNACSPWSPETADLLRRVGRLPGGRDFSFRNSLARLSANADAARHAWGKADPDLADLLAAND